MTEKKKTGHEIGSIQQQWGVFGNEDDEDTDMPVEQHTSKPVRQLTSKAAKQDDSIPVLMKGTYYITPAHDLKLERIRLARKMAGQKVDKSALIREAIDLLKEV